MLTPGAGADRDHRTLVAVQQALEPMPCLRLDFPYRRSGRRAPDRPPVAIAHLVAQATAFADEHHLEPGAIALGGRSYGGRMCSMAVAQGFPAAGLVLLSYPLHPPGAPEKLRVDHFAAITVPVLVVSGEKDPFGSPAEFDQHLAKIAGPVTTVWLPGGHDPRADDRIATTVHDWLDSIPPS